MDKLELLQTLLLCDRPTHKTIATPAIHALVTHVQKPVKRILVIGGRHGPDQPCKRGFEYDWNTDTWTELKVGSFVVKKATIPYVGPGPVMSYATHILDGKVFITNYDGSPQGSNAVIFDPKEFTDTTRPSRHPFESLPKPVARYMCDYTSGPLVTLHDGRVARFGGRHQIVAVDVGVISNAAYDPVTGKLEVIHIDRQPYDMAASVVLRSGEVLITGGAIGFFEPTEVCTIYDPKTGGYRNVAPLNRKRFNHAGCLLSNGHVFVYGGHNDRTFEKSVEIYDPIADKWTTIEIENDYIRTGYGWMTRIRHVCVQLTTGLVLISSGASRHDFLLYDPETNMLRNAASIDDVVRKDGQRDIQGFMTIILYD